MLIREEQACPSATRWLKNVNGDIARPRVACVQAAPFDCSQDADIRDDLQNSTVADGLRGAEQRSGESVPQDLQRLATQHLARFRALLDQRQPESLQYGQIWTTKMLHDMHVRLGEDEGSAPRMVVVLDFKHDGAGDEDLASLVAAPISLDLANRADCDLTVFENESPLGYRFMIEAWNDVSMLSTQLARYLGTLCQPAKRYLGLVYQAHLGLAVDVTELADRLGPAIREASDPRAAFQEEEVESCEYLRWPLLTALAAREQGDDAETVRHLARRHIPSGAIESEDEIAEMPLTVGDVAAKLRAEHAIGQTLGAADRMVNQRLLSSTIPLPASITPEELVRLAIRLQVEASERYWERFRRAALKLAIARQDGRLELEAARRQTGGTARRRQRRTRRPEWSREEE